MMYLYIGYYAGFIKSIHTSKEKLDLKGEPYMCETMNDVIYALYKDERTNRDLSRRVDDKEVFIFNGWNISIVHKVLVHTHPNGDREVWFENEEGELVSL